MAVDVELIVNLCRNSTTHIVYGDLVKCALNAILNC